MTAPQAPQTPGVPTPAPPAETRRRHRSRVLTRLLRNKSAVAAMLVLALLVLVAIAGEWLTPHEPNKVSLPLRLWARRVTTGSAPTSWAGTC